MSEQPMYTYTDAAGRSLSVEVDAGQPLIIAAEGEESTFIYAPTGDEAVAVARAILDLGGDTGHMVVSVEESARTIRIRESIAAQDMQERVIAALGSPQYAAAAIRALPLLPDDTRVADATCLECLRALAQAETAGRGDEGSTAPRDSDLIQAVRALVKRYGAPAVAYEAARQARHE